MKKYVVVITALMLGLWACKKDDVDAPECNVPQLDETPYVLEHQGFPNPDIPSDNPLTKSKVKLGRMLFYDRRLSGNQTQSCADCHLQSDGFSDIRTFSIGAEGQPGNRQAMAAINLAWNHNGFFWDGRAAQLREQALLPIQDPLEMNETLPNLVNKLSGIEAYNDQFVRAFGDETITADRIGLALEAFMFTIVANNSKYDRYLRGEETLTASEERGRELFFTEYNPFFPEQSGADCAHCHTGITLENDDYMNNGLDEDAEFTDLGRFEVTDDEADKAKFKVTTLRNIELTPPYMHDGRFATLEEVVEHYNSGIKESSTVDPAILATKDTGLMLTEQDKADLVAFLKTLTDESITSDARFASPW